MWNHFCRKSRKWLVAIAAHIEGNTEFICFEMTEGGIAL